MEHRSISKVLILAGAVAGVGGAAILFGVAPLAAVQMRGAYPENAHLFWPVLLYIWSIGALYAAALWQYLCICVRIGKNQSFCQENAQSMRIIAALLLIAALLCLAGVAAALAIGLGTAWLLFLLIGMASGAMGLLAMALGRLLFRAVQLQEENDLTV